MKWVTFSLLAIFSLSALSGCRDQPTKAIHFSPGPFADNDEDPENDR